MSVRVSPLGLPAEYSGDVTRNAPSASAPAQAGTVTVNIGAGLIAQLGPLILAGPVRTINPIVGSISVNLVGAQAIGQGEELEGADLTMLPDGAEVLAGAGIPVAFEGLNDIVNPNAVTSVVSNYEVDDRSNFRHYPEWDRLSKMRKEWTGLYTADPDIRNPQDFQKSRGSDPQVGPDSPEADDSFITVLIDPDDL